MVSVCSVDYLQVFGHIAYFNQTSIYTFKQEEFSTRQFRSLFNVYNAEGELYATIQKNPFSPVIHEHAAIIKLANVQLYKASFIQRFRGFCDSIGFEFKSISRVDVCVDMNEFYNGLQCQSFIRRFMHDRLLKNGRATYAVRGEQTDKHVYEYLRFGSNKSACAAYLYNKSKEMRDVKQKPYIIEKWEAAGLDVSRDIWRLEVSVKGSDIKVLVPGTGEYFDIDFDFLCSDVNVLQLFKLLTEKYFDFKINDGTKNKTRMKSIRLIDYSRAVWRAVKWTPKACSNVSDRIFLKKLHCLEGELYDFPAEIKEAAISLEAYFIAEKSLLRFYDEKIAKLVGERSL